MTVVQTSTNFYQGPPHPSQRFAARHGETQNVYLLHANFVIWLLLDDSKWCCGANVLSHAAHQPHCCCRAIITNLLDGLMVLESEEKLNPTQK
jgi:hypothetical protein